MTAAIVTPSFVRPDGTLVAEGAQITVPPQSMLQLSVPAMLGTTPPVEDGFIHFASSQPLFTFASVVDHRPAISTLLLARRTQRK